MFPCLAASYMRVAKAIASGGREDAVVASGACSWPCDSSMMEKWGILKSLLEKDCSGGDPKKVVETEWGSR